MEPAWKMNVKREGRRRNVCFEGHARSPVHGLVNEITVVIGPDFASLDLVAPWTSSLALYREFTILLGPPDHEFTPVVIGEVIESCFVGHAHAMWNFDEKNRDEIIEKVSRFLAV